MAKKKERFEVRNSEEVAAKRRRLDTTEDSLVGLNLVTSESKPSRVFDVEKIVVKIIGRMKKKFHERMTILIQNQHQEIEELKNSSDEERAQLEDLYNLEVAVLLSIHAHNSQMAADKLKALEDQYSKRLEEHRNKLIVRLKSLEDKHSYERDKENELTSKWKEDIVEEHVEFLRKLPHDDSEDSKRCITNEQFVVLDGKKECYPLENQEVPKNQPGVLAGRVGACQSVIPDVPSALPSAAVNNTVVSTSDKMMLLQHSAGVDAIANSGQKAAVTRGQSTSIPNPRATNAMSNFATCLVIGATVDYTVSSCMPVFSYLDPPQSELARIQREADHSIKIYEKMKQQLRSECDKEIAETVAQIHKMYETKSMELDAAVKCMKDEMDAYRIKVFRDKCMEPKVSVPPGMAQASQNSLRTACSSAAASQNHFCPGSPSAAASWNSSSPAGPAVSVPLSAVQTSGSPHASHNPMRFSGSSPATPLPRSTTPTSPAAQATMPRPVLVVNRPSAFFSNSSSSARPINTTSTTTFIANLHSVSGIPIRAPAPHLRSRVSQPLALNTTSACPPSSFSHPHYSNVSLSAPSTTNQHSSYHRVPARAPKSANAAIGTQEIQMKKVFNLKEVEPSERSVDREFHSSEYEAELVSSARMGPEIESEDILTGPGKEGPTEHAEIHPSVQQECPLSPSHENRCSTLHFESDRLEVSAESHVKSGTAAATSKDNLMRVNDDVEDGEENTYSRDAIDINHVDVMRDMVPVIESDSAYVSHIRNKADDLSGRYVSTPKRHRIIDISHDSEPEAKRAHINRTTRGPCYMNKLSKRNMKGEKIRVKYDVEGNPLGDVGTQLRSYIGSIVRTRISIDYKNWKSVPKQLKELAWNEILKMFDGCQTHKSTEMRFASTAWRNFRSKLAREYIHGNKKDRNPKEMYKFINPEVWENFVALRTNEDAMSKRNKAIEQAKANKYHHTMSRGGYRQTAAKLKEEKIASLLAAGMIPEGKEFAVSIDRFETWKRGRVKNNGEYLNKDIDKISQKIDDLEQQSTQGLFMPQGRHDILTHAIGTDEYPGRTRGKGSLIGWRVGFPKSSTSIK